MNTSSPLLHGLFGSTLLAAALLGCDSTHVVGQDDPSGDGGSALEGSGGSAPNGAGGAASGGGNTGPQGFSVFIDVEDNHYEIGSGSAVSSIVSVSIVDGTALADAAAATPALGCRLDTDVEPSPEIPAQAASARVLVSAPGRDPVELHWDGGVLQGELVPPLSADEVVTVAFQDDSSVLAGESFSATLDPVEFLAASYLDGADFDFSWTPRADRGQITVFHLDGASVDQAAFAQCELPLGAGAGSVPAAMVAQVVALYDAEEAARAANPDPALPPHRVMYTFGRTAVAPVEQRQGHHVLVRATHRPEFAALFSSDTP